jgi:hypothetical protein
LTKDSILKALSHLERNDLKEIKNRCDFLMTMKKEDGLPVTVSLLWDELEDKLHTNGYILYKFAFEVVRTNMKKTFDSLLNAHNHLNKYASEGFDNGMPSRIELLLFYRLFIKITLHWMVERNLPVINEAAVLNSHVVFPALFNTQFPGYHSAKLLKMLLK